MLANFAFDLRDYITCTSYYEEAKHLYELHYAHVLLLSYSTLCSALNIPTSNNNNISNNINNSDAIVQQVHDAMNNQYGLTYSKYTYNIPPEFSSENASTSFEQQTLNQQQKSKAPASSLITTLYQYYKNNYALLLFDMGDLYMCKQQFKEALEYLNASTFQNNKFSVCYVSRALCHSNIYKHSEKVSSSSSGTIGNNGNDGNDEDEDNNNNNNAIDDGNSVNHDSESAAHLSFSLHDCDTAIELFPTYYDAHVLKGFVYYMGLNDNERAKECLTKAIELQPDKKIAYLHRSSMHSSTQDYTAALDDMIRSHQCSDYIVLPHMSEKRQVLVTNTTTASDHLQQQQQYKTEIVPICCQCCCPCHDILQIHKQQQEADFHYYCGCGHFRYSTAEYATSYDDFKLAAESVLQVIDLKNSGGVAMSTTTASALNTIKQQVKGSNKTPTESDEMMVMFAAEQQVKKELQRANEDYVTLVLNQAFCLFNAQNYADALIMLDKCVQMKPSLHPQVNFAIERCMDEVVAGSDGEGLDGSQ